MTKRKIKVKGHLRKLKKKRKVTVVRRHKRRIKKRNLGSTPEWKKQYYQRPKVKAQRLAYQNKYYLLNTEERRAYQRAYSQRPEIKARRVERRLQRRAKHLD